MANSKALPQTYLLITIAVMVVLHLSFPLKRLALYPANLLGCIPLLAGMALILAGLALLWVLCLRSWRSSFLRY